LQRTHGDVRPVETSFGIASVNENSSTARPTASFDVAGAVSDHEAPRQIDLVTACRAQEHARSRLPAIAVIGRPVRTRENGVNADPCTQTLMHLLDNVSADESVADVGLIGDNNDEVSMFLQRLDRSRCVRNQPEIIESPGSVGSAGAYQRAAQHAVTV
jgi:hypothetical protein